mmetsp:Transcript_2631/g.5507  ORF Transcript_2631/g.5507 Transcript_2631/m.5507 type:complete len:240 (+) Transcript_2631:2607-3326(+)
MTVLVIDEELDSAGVLVLGGGCELDSVLVQLLAKCHRQRPCGSHLDNLLVAALNGAITLPQVDDVALAVTDNLDLNVARSSDETLDEHRAIAEGGFGLGGSRLEERDQIVHLPHNTHALAAAAHGSLDDDWETHLVDEVDRLLRLGDWAVGAGHHGHASLNRGLARRCLVGKPVQVFHGGPHKSDAVIGTCGGELGRLGEESVAWVDSVDASFLGDTDNLRDVEVRRDRRRISLLIQHE